MKASDFAEIVGVIFLAVVSILLPFLVLGLTIATPIAAVCGVLWVFGII
jgi:hypothetical protein